MKSSKKYNEIMKQILTNTAAVRYWIGIDPGTKTGMAIWTRGTKTLQVNTVKIHLAMATVMAWKRYCAKNKELFFVRVEDPRQIGGYKGEQNPDMQQGVGSIKRDASIWNDFLEDEGIPFEMVRPRQFQSKWSPDYFQKITGHKGRTSEHARDAAALVFGK